MDKTEEFSFEELEKRCYEGIKKRHGPMRKTGRGMCSLCRTTDMYEAIDKIMESECPYADNELQFYRDGKNIFFSYKCKFKSRDPWGDIDGKEA